jgi:putative hydrolase of the HAD superfamily
MKVISFDLDGTLVTDVFSQIVWHQGIPELYAKKHGRGLDEAKSLIFKEYSKVGDKAIEWYDIKYWLQFFDIDCNWEMLLGKFKDRIDIYPEVPDVLSSLSKTYQLIITSNAAREFLDAEIEETNIAVYFDHIFSATSDFKEVKKTEAFYLKICNLLHINHTQIIHVGDHLEFDYLIPQKLGIRSFYLDRKGEKKGANIVKDLKEFEKKLKKNPYKN